MKDEILNYIKQNNGIEVPALQDKFNLSYIQSKEIIDGLVSNGTLIFESGVKYVCANKSVDAGKSESKAEHSETDLEEQQRAERRKYLEERRQELIRRMMADMDDDDNDDDDDDDDEDDDDDDGDVDPTRLKIIRSLKAGMNVYSSEDRVFISVPELGPYSEDNCFELIANDDKIYITDQGAAIISLNERLKLDTEGVDEEIGRILDLYDVAIVGDELRVEVANPEEAVAYLMRLYAAMEAVHFMDEDIIYSYIEREKSDARCRGIITQLVQEDHEIDRTQAIMRVRKMWNEVQNNDDYDAVYAYVNATRVLAALDDDDFDTFRKHLLGEGTPDVKTISDDADESKDVANIDKTELPTKLKEEITYKAKVIEDTLAGFRIDAEVRKVAVGATVTRYDIDIPDNITVNSVIKRDGEITMRLRPRDGVRMYADSATGKISIEVPNSVRETVPLHAVMNSENYLSDEIGSMMFVIGKDVDGRAVCGNLAKMKHILVGGSTGSGKSIFLHSMIASLINKYSPKDLRLILIDAKKTEFAIYKGLPHLLTGEIVSEAEPAINSLNWAIKEMERRYSLFAKKCSEGKSVRNIDEYNLSREKGEKRLPRIVIIVDELADLMMVARREMEERIQRLVQKARAAGIHVVLATQRPSVDVVTGMIKANMPSRIAFRTIRELDSRILLDESGAEKLLGEGDMLYKTDGMFECSRVQGAYISSAELMGIVDSVKGRYKAHFDKSSKKYIERVEEAPKVESVNVPPMYIKALAIVIKSGNASISFLQRECAISYNHAVRIIEWMETKGYVSNFNGKTKTREILITKEEFEALYGPLD